MVMNEKTKKILSNAILAVGCTVLAVNLAADIFFSGFEKWADSLLDILGVGLILGGDLLRKWKQDMSLVSKTMIILVDILLVAALILILLSRHDTFLMGFGRGVMLVAFFTYIILFFRTQYKGE